MLFSEIGGDLRVVEAKDVKLVSTIRSSEPRMDDEDVWLCGEGRKICDSE